MNKLDKRYRRKIGELLSFLPPKLQRTLKLRQGWIGEIGGNIERIGPTLGSYFGVAYPDAWSVDVEKIAEEVYKTLDKKSSLSPDPEVSANEFERVFQRGLNLAVVEEVSHICGDWGHYPRLEFNDEEVYKENEEEVSSFLEEHSSEILHKEFTRNELFIVPAKNDGKVMKDLQNLYKNLNLWENEVMTDLHDRFEFLSEPAVSVRKNYGKEVIKETAKEITEY